MLERVRLLPVVIVAASLLLGVKVGNIWLDAERILGFSTAHAKSGDPKTGEAPAGKTDTETKTDTEAKTETEGEGGTPGGETAAGNRPDGTGSADRFSRAELEVLQNLSKRREELEGRTKELDMRENLLKAAEQRIDGKITELKKIEAAVRALLREHDEEEERQLKSLVKIYEKMKPKDAARILEKLDMDILISVTGRMREARMAPIMAQMESDKAKALTMELATRRRLPVTLEEATAGG